MSRNHSLVLLAIFIGISCASSAEAQLGATGLNSVSMTKNDLLLAALMRFYAFKDYQNTSDTLLLEIKPVLGENKSFYDGYSAIRTYTAVRIWWPGHKHVDFESKQLLMDIILPAIETPLSSATQSDLSRSAYEMYLRLHHINEPWQDNIAAYSRIVDQIKAERLKDPMPALVKSQRVSFQDININEAILQRLAMAFPEAPPPIGIYLEYWQDPSQWTLW